PRMMIICAGCDTPWVEGFFLNEEELKEWKKQMPHSGNLNICYECYEKIKSIAEKTTWDIALNIFRVERKAGRKLFTPDGFDLYR
ncbi:hypothetical protein BX616_003267, partial [Lobosporangium transversale]